jgi:hypothetical protein
MNTGNRRKKIVSPILCCLGLALPLVLAGCRAGPIFPVKAAGVSTRPTASTGREQPPQDKSHARVARLLKGLDLIPATALMGEMERRGFNTLSERDLWRKVAGNTLAMSGANAFFGKDRRAALKVAVLGGGLTSPGNWRVKASAVCHSSRRGHEFCTGLFFKGDDVVCWAGLGRFGGTDTYLKPCDILPGNVLSTAPVRTATNNVLTLPKSQVDAAMERWGFAQLSKRDLWLRFAGKTLKMATTLGYYDKSKRVKLRDTALGGGLSSQGTWKMKGSTICHTVRKGHEFCTGLYFRGDEVVCWPGAGKVSGRGNHLLACTLLPGDRAG